MRKIKIHIILAALLAMPLTSCVYDTYDNNDSTETGPAQMRITVAMPLGVIGEGGEYGTGWENYIDFAGDDWRLYLFNDSDDCEVYGEVTAGDLLSVTANADSTKYTMVANFPDGFLESIASNARIGYCLLANWGYYETVTLGKTLLLSLVDELYANFSFETAWGYQAGGEESFSDDYAKFDAMVDENGTALMPSKDVRIPFYGAQKTESLNLKQGEIWDVYYEITSIRAVAKVEVIMESTNVEIEELKLVGYNNQGYSGLPIYKRRGIYSGS
ncbi:MAG: hypothetical protein LUD72_05645, partial [Bacteroidales bacterium]|nr:hypothetical protein [Bacteroidales bacterium]